MLGKSEYYKIAKNAQHYGKEIIKNHIYDIKKYISTSCRIEEKSSWYDVLNVLVGAICELEKSDIEQEKPHQHRKSDKRLKRRASPTEKRGIESKIFAIRSFESFCNQKLGYSYIYTWLEQWANHPPKSKKCLQRVHKLYSLGLKIQFDVWEDYKYDNIDTLLQDLEEYIWRFEKIRFKFLRIGREIWEDYEGREIAGYQHKNEKSLLDNTGLETIMEEK